MHKLPTSEPRRPLKPLRWQALVPWLVAAWLATGLYTVGTNERALVRRLGRALPQLRAPGLHLGFPYGIDRVTKVRMLERKRVPVSMGLSDRTLGRLAEPRSAECLTGDRNLILVSAVAQYEIVDARAYLFNASDVAAVVSGVTASALASIVSSKEVDDVLTVDRLAIQEEVRRIAQETLERCGMGVRLTAVPLEGLSPPQEVAEAFRDVTRAREDRQRVINEADGYAKRLLPRARGESERIQLEAEGYHEEAVETARGDTARFSRMAEEASRHRELTFRRLLLETMERVLPRLRKIVLDEAAADDLDLGLLEDER